MTATAGFPGFYRGAINLWVEDPLTRDYLRKVWQDDPAIVFYVGGGADGIAAVLQEAEVAALPNVFAYVDRDFRLTNRGDWGTPGKTSRRFLSSVHEIENHLLDCDALAGCALNTRGRAVAAIHARLRKRAEALSWWMACRRLIAATKERTLEDFPPHPTCEQVSDGASAQNYLLGLSWWKRIQAYTPTLDAANLAAELVAHHNVVQDWLQSAEAAWLTEFSGKELFRHVRGWVYTAPAPRASPTELDSDLAKAVGEGQATNGRVPAELQELQAALHRRTRIP